MSTNSLKSLFTSSIRTGNIGKFRNIINSINISDQITSTGWYTALKRALKYKHFKIAKLLLANHANVFKTSDPRLNPLLHYTIKIGNLSIVKLLLERGADVNSEESNGVTALHVAVLHQHLTIVQCLLREGALVNLKCTLPDKAGYTALHLACEIPNDDFARVLLDSGADVNSKSVDDIQPIHIAVLCENEKIIHLLLRRGANINSHYQDCNIQSRYFYPPTLLSFAVETKNLNVAKILIKYGASIYAQDDNGKTLLMYAVENNDIEMVKLLLSNGAVVNDFDNVGRTVLNFLTCNNTLCKYNSI
ncbi:putative ankyrin repeat protein RF_0381 [Microplitis mediator]|uniref:putative ankyrin repeat protein RF_0381 n=1 Tax=Microplitis mediator TaxID=375433 RepID=UPI0025579A1A|nr:putative ankyrin repeat protein RF_0381 [Microplitis mediator]